MFIDDEILAEKHRRTDPYPALIIAMTTLIACLMTVASAFTVAA
nr:hypothetical protein [uncultured Gellertiella sp.]